VDLAVKVVAPVQGSLVDPALRAETEARALARLRGVRGIAALHQVGRTDDGAAWLAQDLIEGTTLSAGPPSSPAALAAIGAQVAVVLDHAHDRQVAHGDLQPSNVVIGPASRVHLVDFGLAGLGFAPDDPGGLTPAFAAPERLRGAPADPASDVWSLGATLAAVLAMTDAPDPGVVEVAASCRAPRPQDRPSARAAADALAAVAAH
jgi:serine/threonine protein kinase